MNEVIILLRHIKSVVNTEDKKRLVSNFFYLSILQAANYVLPLITFPYLVRVLGADYFGLLAFATATVAYFGLITDYGFNLTTPRLVSIHRDDKEKISEIVSSVMVLKFFLMVLSFLLLTALVFAFEKFKQNGTIYFLTFGTVIGQFLFPVWFFQGMERMKYITYINIGTRIAFTIAVFIFIRNKKDYYLVPIFNSLGIIAGGLYSLYLIKRSFNIQIFFPGIATLKNYLAEATNIFISNVAISLYTISTTIILGLFTNNTIVGYYAAADKLIQAFKGLMGPVSQTIYPHIAKKTNQSKQEGLFFIRKITRYIGVMTGCISIFIFIFAELIVNILLGKEYHNSILVLRIMAILPFMIALSNIFGIQTMLNFGKQKAFSSILIIGSSINIVLSFLLVPLYKHIGSAVSVVLVESFITMAMFIYLQTHDLKIIGEFKI